MPIHFVCDDVEFRLKHKQKTVIWLQKIAYSYHYSQVSLQYVFCSDESLIKINRDFLNHNYYTDVITFDYSTKKRIIGEIFISIDRVEENSKNFNSTFESELLRVMVHGLLHLLGHTDASKDEKEEMRKLEDLHISRF